MKIIEFVDGFVSKKIMNTPINQNAVSDYIKKELEVKDYIPFAEKRELCSKVLNTCNTKSDNGLIKVDSVARYFIFTVSILSAYTNLEFSSGKDEEFDAFDEYDMLCQNDLLNSILDVIGAEYTTCNNILNMMMADVVANNNTIENVVGNTLNGLLDIVSDFADILGNKVESLNFDLNQIDIDKYKGLIEMFAQK